MFCFVLCIPSDYPTLFQWSLDLVAGIPQVRLSFQNLLLFVTIAWEAGEEQNNEYSSIWNWEVFS